MDAALAFCFFDSPSVRHTTKPDNRAMYINHNAPLHFSPAIIYGAINATEISRTAPRNKYKPRFRQTGRIRETKKEREIAFPARTAEEELLFFTRDKGASFFKTLISTCARARERPSDTIQLAPN